MKSITLLKSQLPSDVNQTGWVYHGKDCDMAVFETSCEKGRYAFLMKDGVKISRGKRICSFNIKLAVSGKEKLSFGKLIFE